MNLLPLTALLPAIYLAANTIVLHYRKKSLLGATHLLVALAGFGLSTFIYGIQSTWSSALVAGILFGLLVWTGVLSRSLTFVLPALAAMIPVDDYLVLYSPALALVAYVSIRDIVKRESFKDVINTAIITYSQPIKNAAETVRDTAKVEKANIPVIPLLGIGVCFAVVVFQAWILFR
jgi:hypothetical protein